MRAGRRGNRQVMRIDRVHGKAPYLLSAVFFSSLFLYFWLRINPSFYGLEQNIVFLSTCRFLQEYLSYPGGIIDYCSAFLSIFFVYPLVGATVITILLMLIAYATHELLRLVCGPRTWNTAHLFPVVLCGALQSNYDHPLSVTLALGVALLLFVVYGYQRFRRTSIRALFYLFLGGSLYYGAGGAFLVFAFLCVLHEAMVCQRWTLAVFYGAVAVVVPYLAKAYLFLISTHDAYLHLLPFGDLGYNVPILPYVLYAYFPAFFLIAPGSNLFMEKKNFSGAMARFFEVITPRLRALISGFILIAVTLVTFTLSFHRNDNAALRFSSMCLKSQWTGILKAARENPANTSLLTNFAVTQALYHTGMLPVEQFSFPPYFGIRGIFLSDDETGNYGKLEAFSFFHRGELAFKLGLVNSAQHWYYEAISTQGVTAAALIRLSQIHALKGDFSAARICLSILETMPMQRTWALQFGSRLDDRSFLSLDPELAAIRRSMPTADFLLADGRQSYHDCEETLQQHTKNRMTFEYCMASYLLLSNFSKIASLIGYLDTLGYSSIPPLYEQALVMLKAGNYQLPSTIADRISQTTLDNFLVIDGLLYQFQGDLGAAKNAMYEKFRDSYWYYFFYIRPKVMGEQ
jgi:hypothetical protein